MSDWSYKTAVELSAALAAGPVPAVALAEDAIARIEAHDGAVNAVCVRDFDGALQAARAADKALAAGERRPLLGIPMTVKESYNIAGLPTTWGFPAAKDFVPPDDALAVARAKAAGAVILGRPMCRPGSAAFKATTTSTARPAIRGTWGAHPAGPRAGRPPRSRQAMGRSRWARTSAGRSGPRRIFAASMPISRAWGWSPCAATRHRARRRCRANPTSRWSGRWRAA